MNVYFYTYMRTYAHPYSVTFLSLFHCAGDCSCRLQATHNVYCTVKHILKKKYLIIIFKNKRSINIFINPFLHEGNKTKQFELILIFRQNHHQQDHKKYSYTVHGNKFRQ